MEVIRRALTIVDGRSVDRSYLELPRPGEYWEDDLYELIGDGKDSCDLIVTLYDTVTNQQSDYRFNTYMSCIEFMQKYKPYGFAYQQGKNAFLVYIDDWSLEFLSLVDKVEMWSEYRDMCTHDELVNADRHARGLDDFSTLFECVIDGKLGVGTLFQAVLLLQHGFRGNELLMCSDEYFDDDKFGVCDEFIDMFRVTFTDIDEVHRVLARAGLVYPNPIYRQITGKGFDIRVADS